MITAELWKTIDGFSSFEVSNHGRIRNVTLGLMKSTRVTKNGYVIVTLKQDGQKYTRYVHRLVASAFCPNPEGHPVVNHKDENKENNHADNLEWCSYSYNALYMGAAQRAGDKMRGTHPKCKKVRCVETGEVYPSVREAARAKGITMGISYCLTGKQSKAGGYSWEVVK